MSDNKRFKVAMIARERAQIPSWVLAKLDSLEGLELVCRNCQSREDLLSIAADADMIWTMGPNLLVTEDVLPKLKRCKVIFRSGSGMDGFAIGPVSQRGIHLCNCPESISEAVAEHAVSLLFALIRQIPMCDAKMRGYASPAPAFKWHISGRVMGLVGFGRIARRVAEMMAGFRMTLLAYDPFMKPEAIRSHGVEPCELDDLLARSDYVSVHCPLTEQTRRLINARRLAIMKPLSLLINTSRGDVIDEDALCDALATGRPAGAALDVTTPEPPIPKSRIFQAQNVILTPHIAASSADFERNFYGCSIQVITECMNGDFNTHCMNRTELAAHNTR